MELPPGHIARALPVEVDCQQGQPARGRLWVPPSPWRQTAGRWRQGGERGRDKAVQQVAPNRRTVAGLRQGDQLVGVVAGNGVNDAGQRDRQRRRQCLGQLTVRVGVQMVGNLIPASHQRRWRGGVQERGGLGGGDRLQLDDRGGGQRPAHGDGLLELLSAAGQHQGLVGVGPVELGDGDGARWPGQLVQAI